MLRRFLYLTVIFLATLYHGIAQNMTVLNEETVIDVDNDMHGYKLTCTSAYLANNSKAAKDFNFAGSFDTNHTLTSFNGTVSCGTNFSKKIHKSDLKRTEYSPDLANDSYTLYSEIAPPTYPALISYTYTIIVDKEMIYLPPFNPQKDYNVDVAHASWTMHTPRGFKYHHAISNNAIQHNIKNDNNGTVIEFTADNIKNISKEPFTKSLRERLPMAIVVPDTIIYYGTHGSQRTWKELGEWTNAINSGKDGLSADAISAIHEVSDTCKTTIEKIAAIKSLLAERTHYVSIQLGIGGYQAAAANSTWSLGFGECKGLCKLMQAMLKEAGINSKLVAVNLGDRFFIDSLPTLAFMNHMILEVPMDKETYWIECTSSKIPANYIHEDIAGHHALEISDNGGKLVCIPEYSDSINKRSINANIKLNADGKAHISINDRRQNSEYEDALPLLSMTHDELSKVSNAMYHLSTPLNQTVSVVNLSSPYMSPSLELHTDADCQYGRMAGKRMFVSLSPSNDLWLPTITNNRKEDFYIRNGFITEETTTITLPTGYTIESMPEDTTVTNDLGTASLSLSQSGSSVKVLKVVHIKNGTYPANNADKFKTFFQFLRTLGNSKLVLIKN